MPRCLTPLFLVACSACGPAGSSGRSRGKTTETTATNPAPTTTSARACAPFDPAFEAELQAGLEAAHLAQGFPGAALAVVRPGTDQCWASSVGLADLDGSVPWEVDAPYPIGSVTKTFTTALIFQLVEDGHLSLDDPLDDWLSTAWSGQGITLRHLLQHSSGIASYNYVASFDSSATWTPTELVDWAATHDPDLHFPPGTAWEYSNTNFVLLALVAEAATGTTYETELETRFFDPLGLDHTWLATDNPPDLVRGYRGVPLADDTDNGNPTGGWSAGGVISTPADLAAWGEALFEGRVVSQASLATMQTPFALAAPDAEYGLGLFGNNGDEYGPFWGHTGGTGGHLTYMYYLEREDMLVVAMLNSMEADLDRLAEAAWIPILQ